MFLLNFLNFFFSVSHFFLFFIFFPETIRFSANIAFLNPTLLLLLLNTALLFLTSPPLFEISFDSHDFRNYFR